MYMVGYIALLPIMQQYIYRRLSVDFNITDASNENKSSREICLERVDDSTSMTATEKDFQESVSLWNTVMVVCGLLPTLFVVVIIGPLTDLRGRKFGLVPQVGSAVLAGILITVVVAFDVHIATLPVIQFICGMTGGWYTWWRHQMEVYSALLALCAWNSPVTGEFPSQRPVTRRLGVFFDLRLNTRLSKQSRRRWFATPSCSLWRHCNDAE